MVAQGRVKRRAWPLLFGASVTGCSPGTGRSNWPEVLGTHHRYDIKNRLLQSHRETASCPDCQLSFRAKAFWSLGDTTMGLPEGETSQPPFVVVVLCPSGLLGASDARKENRSLLIAEQLAFITPHPVLFVVILFLYVFKYFLTL